MPVFIKSAWGFDERYIGILMAMNGLMITFFEMPAIHGIEKNGKVKISMLAGLMLVSTSFLPFLLPKALVFCFLAMFLLTIGEILYMPLNSSVALNMSPGKRRGDYMAWYSMMWSLTHIAGPTIGLAVIDEAGFSVFWIIVSLLATLSFLISIRLFNRHPL